MSELASEPSGTAEPSVALVGIHGHGASHLAGLRELHEAGHIRLAALCDRVPPTTEPTVPFFDDHRTMLAAVRPDVTIIVTPPHTHLAIARDAARAGSDVLLEKPPVTSMDEHDQLMSVLARTGRACQVGFQHLGSMSAARLHKAIKDGLLGKVTGIAVAGQWIRTDGYYRRAAWAGRSRVDGVPTADGALANPFAHAVMQCLATAEAATGDAWPRRIELELYRARDDIEVDDTACLRMTLGDGLTCVVAVTLCAERHLPPMLTVHGTAGTAELEFTIDRLRLPDDPAATEVPGRVDLLADLLAHRSDPTHRLLVPLSRTAPFTYVLAEVIAAQPATPIDPAHRQELGAGEERRVVVDGVDAAITEATRTLATFHELGVPWASRQRLYPQRSEYEEIHGQ